MQKLLVIETSPRGNKSVSRHMTQQFISRWKEAYPDGLVTRRDLNETELTFINVPWLDAYFTPAEQHTAEMKGVLSLSDELVAELQAADHLVIATPVYNYNVPATLKAWIDHIVRKGLTLGFDGKGLLQEKKATVLLASGGVYTEGSPIRDRDIATQYLRVILGVIGLTDIQLIAGGGAKAVDMGEVSMEDFVNALKTEIDAAANR